MNNDLISRTLLRNEFVKYIDVFDLTAWNKINDIIDNALPITPCKNCDLYFKAMTKAAELDKMPMTSKKTQRR